MAFCTIGVGVVGMDWVLGSIVGRLARVLSSPLSIKSAASLESEMEKSVGKAV